MKDFFEKHKNTVLRYWQRKRMWTPFDIEIKDPYQLEYGDDECSHGYLVEVADLGYDWLVGIAQSQEADYIEYFKLNDIELAYCESDQETE